MSGNHFEQLAQQEPQHPMIQEKWVPQEQPQKTKKNKGPLIAIIAAVVVVILTVMAILVYNLVWNTPEARLARGFVRLAEEMAEGTNPVTEEIDYATIAEKMYTEPYSMAAGFNITIPQLKDIGTIGMDMSVDYDYADKMLQGDVLFSAYNIHLLETEYVAVEDMLYVSLPNLAEGTYLVNTKTLGADFNDSVWADMLGTEVADDLSLDLFAAAKEKDEAALDEELQALLERNMVSLSDTMVIEDAGDEVQISKDGNPVSCKGVRVILQKAELNRLGKELAEYLYESGYVEEKPSFSFAENLEICIYMDKKDHIVCMETPGKIAFENSYITEMDLELLFTGTERATDEMELQLCMKTKEAVFEFTAENSSELTKNAYERKLKLTLESDLYGDTMEMVFREEWDLQEKEVAMSLLLTADKIYQMKTEGSFSDIVTGESFAFMLDKMTLQADGEEILKLTGSMEVAPFTDTITVPQDAIDLFHMSEEEANTLVRDFYSSILGMFL